MLLYSFEMLYWQADYRQESSRNGTISSSDIILRIRSPPLIDATITIIMEWCQSVVLGFVEWSDCCLSNYCTCDDIDDWLCRHSKPLLTRFDALPDNDFAPSTLEYFSLRDFRLWSCLIVRIIWIQVIVNGQMTAQHDAEIENEGREKRIRIVRAQNSSWYTTRISKRKPSWFLESQKPSDLGCCSLS